MPALAAAEAARHLAKIRELAAVPGVRLWVAILAALRMLYLCFHLACCLQRRAELRVLGPQGRASCQLQWLPLCDFFVNCDDPRLQSRWLAGGGAGNGEGGGASAAVDDLLVILNKDCAVQGWLRPQEASEEALSRLLQTCNDATCLSLWGLVVASFSAPRKAREAAPASDGGLNLELMNGKKSCGEQSPAAALEETGARAARDDSDGAHSLVTPTALLTLMTIPRHYFAAAAAGRTSTRHASAGPGCSSPTFSLTRASL